jgi:SPX domain protein involved in polyphosphate accumulation
MGNPLSSAVYFQRYEQKYLLNDFQYQAVLKILDKFTRPDEYGPGAVYSVYYDNENFEIARKVSGKSAYKEKLRLRSYGIPHPGDTVYLELKKKLNGLTYKQRIPLPFTGTEQCFDFRTAGHTYIFDEIQWFLRSYNPFPRFMISYNRAAFRGRENSALRITFDSNIRCETAGLDFSSPPRNTPPGYRCLPDGGKGRYGHTSFLFRLSRRPEHISRFVFQIPQGL